jgi:hypothetical protein
MPLFKINKVIICAVDAWQDVEADSMEAALEIAANMGTGNCGDLEIVRDIETKSVTVTIREH